MSTTRKGNVLNYQTRALAFKVGDRVYPLLGGNASLWGTVVAVYPAIGMADVAYPHGTTRAPVEDLVVSTEKNPEATIDIATAVVPGGVGTVSVSGGPGMPTGGAHRVASAYIKQAVYWASKDRQYKPSREELDTNSFCCPRCEESILAPVVYKREDGRSTKLFCCRECLFLIRRNDIMGLE